MKESKSDKGNAKQPQKTCPNFLAAVAQSNPLRDRVRALSLPQLPLVCKDDQCKFLQSDRNVQNMKMIYIYMYIYIYDIKSVGKRKSNPPCIL